MLDRKSCLPKHRIQNTKIDAGLTEPTSACASRRRRFMGSKQLHLGRTTPSPGWATQASSCPFFLSFLLPVPMETNKHLKDEIAHFAFNCRRLISQSETPVLLLAPPSGAGPTPAADHRKTACVTPKKVFRRPFWPPARNSTAESKRENSSLGRPSVPYR